MQQIIISQKGLLQVDATNQQLHDALQDTQSIVWLDIQSGKNLAKYIGLLSNEFQLLPLTIESMQEEKERAKLVGYHHYFYLVVHSLNFNGDAVEADTPKLDIIFGKNFLITSHQQELDWLSDFHKTVREDESEDNIVHLGVPRLLHAILDTMVDGYFPVLDDIDDVVDDLENSTVEQADNEVQTRIFRMKRILVQMRRVISPQVEVSSSLITRTGDFIPTEVEPYFSDVHDHLIRTFEVIDSYRDLMSGLLDVYLTTVSNRQNEIMKQLALISTIFLPITFITGVFGQNFAHSPQVEFDSGWNFWIVLLVMILLSLGQIWYFRHRQWI
ncbi:magnesium/cobalt transporter CorA [Dictyobacter arantiisoli]|uniref:Magnesium transport protein CorA n=1 Tax=Dictyobacter arantiisoli TaxID=2014874 RepID=A0A5A5TEU7_9CHLR|nr:magnesium/cobalt transporter CorA [Dictyobacter arantiisoli]GCF10091.1 magnesium transport protein CorA [Dictyobacter arantiisoli]